VALARGRYDRARVRAAIEGRGGQVTSYRGVPFFQATDSAGAFVADDIFALGTIAGVQAALDVAQSAAPAARGDEPVARLRASVGSDARTAVRVAALMPRDMPRGPRLVSLSARLDVGGGALDLSVTGEHENPAEAADG